MFRWYEDSIVCYVYLCDVLSESEVFVLERSSWFTRGWTLQELLAPEMVKFFDKNWMDIGTKATLEGELTATTGIDHLFNFRKASVAQKMSWAAKRETTRVEDLAYCLMGIFDVNMPIIYGEGASAFIRLQHEIIKISSDESIFAWSPTFRRSGKDGIGLLAEHPIEFRGSGDTVTVGGVGESSYTMTNRGLQIQLQLIPATLETSSAAGWELQETETKGFIAPLRCFGRDNNGRLAIYLRRIDNLEDVFCRAAEDMVFTVADDISFCIPPSLVFVRRVQEYLTNGLPTRVIVGDELLRDGFKVSHFPPNISMDSEIVGLDTHQSSAWVLFEKAEERFFLGITRIARVGVELYVPESSKDIPTHAVHPLDRRQIELRPGYSDVTAILKKNKHNPQEYTIELSIRCSVPEPADTEDILAALQSKFHESIILLDS